MQKKYEMNKGIGDTKFGKIYLERNFQPISDEEAKAFPIPL